ncbi:hypothetical protein RJ640_030506 [Escallonia rubra]|uniref:FAD dependent oxidoreductase domain-containing protein n=1 Tax=Escallonia rubra TaxID=112253 RepID=A0AA88U278_9ASTE|nr:hypothetical protein RJ640_030506 [Escallonia rubra]
MSAEAEVPDDPQQIVPNPESIRVLKSVAKTVSSHFGEGARVTAEQACFLPCTDDSAPVIGEVPGVKGCYVATGHNCWGILNGPATGAAVAELVVDGRASLVDLTPFSPARFSRGRKRLDNVARLIYISSVYGEQTTEAGQSIELLKIHVLVTWRAKGMEFRPCSL